MLSTFYQNFNNYTQNSLFQWLSIGTGYGDCEEKILQIFSKKSGPTIDVLEVFEPGNEQYQHLQSINFGKNIDVRIHKEAFGSK